MRTKKPRTHLSADLDTPVIDAPDDEVLAAFKRVEPLLATVEEPQRILTDIPRTVAIVLGAVANLRPLRPDIVEQLPRFDIGNVDRLGDYALAAWYAHVTAAGPDKRVQPLVDEAVPLRAKLLVAADAHAAFGDLDPSRIDAIRQGSGHLDTAGDLVALAQLFRDSWGKLAHRTPVSSGDVARAEALGTALMRALSDDTSANSAAADRRVRAYTVLTTAYDACRRAVTFVRWHEDDVDSILPTIYPKARARKPRNGSSPGDTTPVQPAAPVGPTPSPEPGPAPQGTSPPDGAPAANATAATDLSPHA